MIQYGFNFNKLIMLPIEPVVKEKNGGRRSRRDGYLKARKRGEELGNRIEKRGKRTVDGGRPGEIRYAVTDVNFTG